MALASLPSIFYAPVPDLIFALSGAIFSFFVVLVHLVSFYGLVKVVRGWISGGRGAGHQSSRL